MPYVGQLYAAHVGHGLPGILLRGCGLRGVPAAADVLMGATLPAIARWVETTPQGVSWLGFFYGGNIAGAVFGCLLAGFYLLRVHDMATATYVAAAINAAVAVIGLVLAALAPHRRAEPPKPGARPPSAGAGPWPVYVAIALSGAGALGAEVIWTRLLSLLLGGTVYTFSIILAVFLVGLGIGSSVGSLLARETGAAAAGAGLLPSAPGRGDRLDRGHARQVAPLLADRPRALHESLVHFQLDLCGACGPSCRRRSFGARASRWRWRRPRRADRTRAGWSEASMRPTRSARSSARSASACS